MKIIFSRKGFDAENGGTASPVMPDGAMVSMPIPQEDEMLYDFVSYNGRTYLDIWMDLKPNQEDFYTNCHLDPDIRRDGKIFEIEGWKPIFGQAGAAQTHLENQGVEVGDIFMFFGWFRKTEEKNGMLKYAKGSKDAHMMFGYLQIGEIVNGEGVLDYPWHPHAYYYDPEYDNNNTMYIASEHLVIDGVDTGLPGAGTFKYSDELVLTMPGQTKSRWLLPEFFKKVNISCHSADSFKPEGYFQTVRIGQEFVVSESKEVTEWAKNIIVNNIDLREQDPYPEEMLNRIIEAASDIDFDDEDTADE